MSLKSFRSRKPPLHTSVSRIERSPAGSSWCRQHEARNIMKRSVGIEAIAAHVPKRYLDLEDLARARGVDPAKYTIGLGARQMAVPDAGEDTVALAAAALQALLARQRIDPAKSGMLAVGTETGVDHSKPVASYVQ